MLLEKLLNELKMSLGSVSIKNLPRNINNNSSYQMFEFYKDKDGIYKDSNDYFFKVKTSGKNIYQKDIKEYVENYGFIIIRLSIYSARDGLYAVDFLTVPWSDYESVNYGKPIAVLSNVTKIVNDHSDKNPTFTYIFSAEPKRMKFYKNIINNLDNIYHKQVRKNVVVFSKNKDALDKQSTKGFRDVLVKKA